MKKNNGLSLNVLIISYALSFSFSVFAADGQANETSTQYVTPTPQQTRIKALEDSLKRTGQGHQINILQAQDSNFLTLYRTALTGDSQGCAILIASDNEHPDWPTSIAPLRNALPQYSWCTVSLEIPDITKRARPVTAFPYQTATVDENTTADESTSTQLQLPNQETVFARINAAIEDAKQKGNEHFVFIGYGTGAAYALHFLAQNKTLAEALVLINIEAPQVSDRYPLAQDLRVIEQPVLDYSVTLSPTQQQNFKIWRKQAANQRVGDTGKFLQLSDTKQTDASSDNQTQTIQRVRGFLKQYTSQVEQLKPLPEYKKGLFYESP